jgi:predicted metal-binding membrane protein
VTASRTGLVLALFAAAAGGWWWTLAATNGMDAGPWTALGSFGWFLGVWVVMMAAMMLPSAAPAVVLYARMSGGRSTPWLFVSGYLVTWTAAGAAAFAAARVGGGLGRAERWTTGAVLLAAAAYELTPLKDRCLGNCRSPFGFLVAAWRDGRLGALRMGAEHGAWCVGCCWALMASLFALGVMSVAWTALVAGLIALEKLAPFRRAATWGTALVLLALGVVLLVHPAGALR